jgi:DNA-binding winged helix-turn-helix (wHTH) protein
VKLALPFGPAWTERIQMFRVCDIRIKKVQKYVESKEFLRFRLDAVNQCLWRRGDSVDEERVSLTPKAFGVLRYLVRHAGRLVTQDELLGALWPRSHVQPEVLKHHVLEVRKALGDDPKNPLFIETLPRRGYRFIAPIRARVGTDFASEAGPAPTRLVGRSAALAALRDYLAEASRGQRQFVSIPGEPGIGKTALVDEFRRQAGAQVPGLRIALGQCVEGFGSQEGYYPMLEALGQLCRGPAGESVVDTLASQAPTWLVQFPALLKREHRETLHRELLGATRERMLREIGDALEAITATYPLLLVFEDLQWVDHSTVDLLSALARRRTPARLMLVGTIRSVEMMPSDHPLKALKRDLLMHGLCHEIRLEPLAEAEVTEYLAAGAPEGSLPKGLAGLIHRNSGGNPLFMILALDHLTRRGLISHEGGTWQLMVPLETIEIGVPENLRQMIEAQIERLSAEEQRALEVASVAGAVFSVSISATAIEVYPDRFEDLYASLARRYRIVRPADPLQHPDGSGSPRYEFVHALYREVLYQRQPPRQRAKLHRRIGERLETLLSQPSSEVRIDDIAAELAHHFEQGMEWDKAIRYTRLASDVAVKRFSPREAMLILKHGLGLVENLRAELRPGAEVQLLERAAMISAAAYWPSAIERYEALAQKAERYGMTDLQVRALVGQAFPTSWHSLSRSERVIARVIEMNQEQTDPVAQSIAQASSHFWRLWLGGWDEHSAAAFRECGVEIEASADRRSLAWYRLEQALIWFVSSRYRDSREQIEREIPVLLKGSIDSPDLNLGLAYWGTYQLVRPWSAIFLGEWTTADREFEEEITLLERNRALYLANTLRLYRAWGQVIAHEFEAARDACEIAVPGLDGDGNIDASAPTAFLPAEERIRLITLGAALVGLGQYGPALVHLEAARQQMLENPVVLNWYWRIAAEWLLAQLWIARADLERASGHANEMLALTADLPEVTWRALALETGTRIAMAERDFARAQSHVAEALSTIEAREVPVAAWRVHCVANELFELAGNAESAQQHRALSRTALLRLGGSLPPGHSFRKKFPTSQPAPEILAGR